MSSSPNKPPKSPESTAARVALWRALHLELDRPPYIFEDSLALKVLNPPPDWRNRPDMDPTRTKAFRASIVARARYIEDLVLEHKSSIDQYVILGAGLDTFAQREAKAISSLKIFEVDQPGPQEWKKERLIDLRFGIPSNLTFVPVDFENGEAWLEALTKAGFDRNKPAIVASTGVSMYLTKEAIADTFRQISRLAPGSIFAMTFLVPVELADPEEKPGFEASMKGAKASGTPFISLFSPDEIVSLALKCGFKKADVVSPEEMRSRYFRNRTDGLKLGRAEQILLATA